MKELNFQLQRFAATINGTAGDDSINNTVSSVVIYAYGGKDTINNSGASVTVDGGAGNDYIGSLYNNVSINGGVGDDYIYSGSSYSTIDGGNGNDYLRNSGSDVQVNGGAGSDSIDNFGYNSTLNGGVGSDSIKNYGRNVAILGEDGNDSIDNCGDSVKVDGGAGNDKIYNSNAGANTDNGSYATIDGGTGNDSIYNSSQNQNVSIFGGAGDDLIDNSGSYVTLNGGGDNDYISNSGDYATIYGGDGNDVLRNGGIRSYIDGGYGNDVLWNGGIRSYIDGGYGNDSISNWSDYSTINGGAGDDSIRNNNASVKVNGGTDNDSIDNYGSNVTIDGGAGNDKIYNNGAYVTIDAGDGNDSIDNTYYGRYATILGGAGNDKIYNSGNYSEIWGGAGADVISLYSGYSYSWANTIAGGVGNDTVYMNSTTTVGNVYQYSAGDGNDRIFGITKYDTISISGASYSTTKSESGSHMVINVDSGSMTLVGGARVTPVIKGTLDGGGNVTVPVETIPAETLPAGWKISSTIAQATLATAGNLDLTENYSSAVKRVNASITSGGVQIIGNNLDNSIRAGKGADTIYSGMGNDTVSLGAGNDVYIYSGGNDVIQDYTAGQDTISIPGASVSSYSISGSDAVLRIGSNTLKVKSGKGKEITVVDKNGSTIYPTVDSGLNYNADSTAVTVKATYAGNTLGASAYPSSVITITAAARTAGINITGNAKANRIIGSKYADTISGGLGNDTVSLGAGNDVYIYTGGNDTIQDYAAGQDTISIPSASVSSYSISGSDAVFKIGSNTLKIKSGKDKAIAVVDKNGSTIYPTVPVGVTINNTVNNTVLSGTAGDDTISNTGTTVKIYAGEGDDSIFSSSKNYNNAYVTIDAGDGNDTVGGYLYASSVSGGTGNDIISMSGMSPYATINGGKGNDTIYGDIDYYYFGYGAGSYFLYSLGDGYDVLYSTKSTDRISIIGGVYTSSTVGSNVILSVYASGANSPSGAMTIVGGSPYSPEISGTLKGGGVGIYNYTSNTVINGTAYKDTVGNYSDNVKAYLGAGNDSIFNSGSSVTIDTGAGNDSIENADDQNVTINAGNGDDTISNGGWYVTIDAGAGNDSIFNWNGRGVKINAGDGKDTILNRSSGVSIDASAGADIISLDSASYYAAEGNNTIRGGTGNDTVWLNSNTTVGNVYQYSAGDGNDTIYGVTKYDTISIGGAAYTTTTSGNDVIVSVGSGKMTFKDAVGTALKIKGTLSSGNTGLNYNADSTAVTVKATYAGNTLGASAYPSSVITITAAARTAGINIEGNAKANRIIGTKYADTISGGLGNDTVSLGEGNDVYIYSGGNDVLQDYAVGDTISIPGASVSSYSISGSDAVFKIGSNTLKVKSGKGKEIAVIDKNGSTIYPTIDSGLNYNADSTAVTVKATYAGNTLSASDYSSSVITITAAARTAGINITGNAKANRIIGSKYADTISGGLGNDTVSLGAGNDVYIYSGGNDLLQDYAAGDTIRFANGISITKVATVSTNVVFTTGAGNFSVKGGKGKDIYIYDSGGERLYPEPEPEPTLPAGWSYSNNNSKVTATKYAENLDLTEEYGAEVFTVDASKTADGIEITGNDNGNSIKGGKGDDIIIGGTGDDTVSMGGGNDLYIYTGGDDVIQDYKNQNGQQDSIQVNIDNATITNVETLNSDLTFTINDGNYFTVKGGVGKEVLIYDADENQIYPSADTLPAGWKYVDTRKTKMAATLATAENLDLTQSYGAEVSTVDASKVTNGIIITANDSGNSIKSGSGNDTIIGGGGNDTVSLGAGNDTYIFNGGDDWVQDYTVAQDLIKVDISGVSITAIETVENKHLRFTFNNGDNGTLTITKGKDKADSVVIVDALGNTINPAGDDFPKGWRYANTGKTKIIATVTSGAEKLDLTEYYGDGVVSVDASTITSGGVEIIGNDGGNAIKDSKGNDTITGGTGNDSISLSSGNDIYIYTGGEDTITGYTAGEDTIKIGVDSAEIIGVYPTLKSHLVFSIKYEDTDGTIVVKNGAGKDVVILDNDENQIYPTLSPLPDGWIFANSEQTAVTVSGTSADDIDLNDLGEDVTLAGAEKLLSKNGVQITCNDSSNCIKGGRGADTLIGGGGADILYGGTGNDLFVYAGGGDDVIMDYASGDTLQIDSDIEFIAAGSIGAAVTVRTNEGAITVNGNTGGIIIIDGDGNQLYPDANSLPNGWSYNDAHTKITATVASAADVDLYETYGDGVKTVDASKTTGGVRIIGNDGGNSIKGGKGADTITGGSGDDSISLGAGADVYIYTGGNDSIQDYAAADSIMFGDVDVTGTSVSGSNFIYMTDAGNLTIKNGKGKSIATIPAADIASSYDIFDDDNFISADLRLDEITAANYAVADFNSDLYANISIFGAERDVRRPLPLANEREANY